MVSRDHAVCLATEHAERLGSPRLHELEDTNAEGAELVSCVDNNDFFGDRSTVAV